MKQFKFLIALASVMTVFATSSAFADIGANQQVQLETQLEARVQSIVDKVDRHAIVQVHVSIKKVTSALPGVWAQDAATTPVANDGSLSMDGIDKIEVRIISQVEEVPAWIKDEVKKATTFGSVRVEAKYEKAKGTVTSDERSESIANAIKGFGKEMTDGLLQSKGGEANQDVGNGIKLALWGIAGGLLLAMLFVSAAVFMLGRKIESSFFRVVDEKLGPLLQSAGGGGSRRSSEARDVSSPASNQVLNAPAQRLSGGNEGGEFAQMSNDALYALVVDCYWTNTDGYAHYIWTELNMKQREFLLSHAEFGKELFRYFTFVRQFPVESLDYHRDVRYLEPSTVFSKVNQKELATYIQAHPAHASLVTPLRWDLLPLSLSERMKMTNSMNTAVEAKPAAAQSLKPSTLRDLPRKLEVKTLTADDEKFLWENPATVPANLRSGLKTLAWLAMAPLDYRQSVLSEVDARDLAEAWTGPEAVLAKLQEAVPAKKFEMVQFFMKEEKPDRDGVIFAHLVSMGAQAAPDLKDVTADKKSKEKAA